MRFANTMRKQNTIFWWHLNTERTDGPIDGGNGLAFGPTLSDEVIEKYKQIVFATKKSIHSSGASAGDLEHTICAIIIQISPPIDPQPLPQHRHNYIHHYA